MPNERACPKHVARIPPHAILTVPEVADLFRVNTKTIYEAVRMEKLPGAFRLGRVVRVHAPTLLAWLEGREAAAEDELLPSVGADGLRPTKE